MRYRKGTLGDQRLVRRGWMQTMATLPMGASRDSVITGMGAVSVSKATYASA